MCSLSQDRVCLNSSCCGVSSETKVLWSPVVQLLCKVRGVTGVPGLMMRTLELLVEFIEKNNTYDVFYQNGTPSYTMRVACRKGSNGLDMYA